MSVQGVDVERAGENDNGCCSKQELKQEVSGKILRTGSTLNAFFAS